MAVLGSVSDNGHLSFGQMETKEFATDLMIKVGVTCWVSTFVNHPSLLWHQSMKRNEGAGPSGLWSQTIVERTACRCHTVTAVNRFRWLLRVLSIEDSGALRIDPDLAAQRMGIDLYTSLENLGFEIWIDSGWVSMQQWAVRNLSRRYNRMAQGGQMADIKRISVQQAYAKTKANQALLVCAYEDEAKCRMLNLDGSISFATLQSRAASLPKTQEIIFYWAWPGEASAVGQAAKYQAQGFTNVNVLTGGVEAWRAAGYSMTWKKGASWAFPALPCQVAFHHVRSINKSTQSAHVLGERWIFKERGFLQSCGRACKWGEEVRLAPKLPVTAFYEHGKATARARAGCKPLIKPS
jgi:rhodanese-related sulfurtransferase